MRFIFVAGRLGCMPTPHRRELLGPAFQDSGPPAPTPVQRLPPACLPAWTIWALGRFLGTSHSFQPSGSPERLARSREPPPRAGHRGARQPKRAPRPEEADRGGSPAAPPGRARGAGRQHECGLSPPPAATPPPAPAACAPVSVCRSSLSTSVGISSQEVRE